MSSQQAPPSSFFRRQIGGFDSDALAAWWPAAIVLLIAAFVRSYIWLNSDVSWLLTLAEQVIGGARAYVDFREPNPPASILLYMPAVLFGQIAHISAESALTLLVFAGVLLCLWLVDRILPDGALVASRERPVLLALGCAILLILPGDNFAERENIALIAILPMLAAYVARARGITVSTALSISAGIGGGIAVAIKPYFALALILPLPYAIWGWRSHRRKLTEAIFWREHLASALVVLLYGAAVLWSFPDYVRETLPLVLTLYVPLRYSLFLMIINTSVVLVAMTMIVALGVGMREFRSPAVGVGFLAVLGFTGALVIQGKGWPYHGYPAVALSLLVLALLLVRRLSVVRDKSHAARSASIDLAFGAVLFACIYAVASYWLLQELDRSALVTAVSRIAPAHPKIVSISATPGIAFPLTRKLHGILVSRAPFQWISAYADRLLTAGTLDPDANNRIGDAILRRTIEDYARVDRVELADSIRTGRPDVILIGGAMEHRWAFAHPELTLVLQPYRRAETFEGIEIWLPRTAPKPAPH